MTEQQPGRQFFETIRSRVFGDLLGYAGAYMIALIVLSDIVMNNHAGLSYEQAFDLMLRNSHLSAFVGLILSGLALYGFGLYGRARTAPIRRQMFLALLAGSVASVVWYVLAYVVPPGSPMALYIFNTTCGLNIFFLVASRAAHLIFRASPQ